VYHSNVLFIELFQFNSVQAAEVVRQMGNLIGVVAKAVELVHKMEVIHAWPLFRAAAVNHVPYVCGFRQTSLVSVFA